MRQKSVSLYRVGAALAAGLVLAGCGANGEDPVFNGVKFAGSADTRGDDRADFVARIKNAARAPSAAVDAGVYQGTKYCIHYLGTSEIAWAVDPAALRAQPRLSGDDLLLQGRCVE